MQRVSAPRARGDGPLWPGTLVSSAHRRHQRCCSPPPPPPLPPPLRPLCLQGACCSAPATAGDYPPYGHTQKPAYNSYPPGVPPVDGYKPAAASSYQHPSAGGSTVQGIPAAGASQAYMPHAHRQARGA